MVFFRVSAFMCNSDVAIVADRCQKHVAQLCSQLNRRRGLLLDRKVFCSGKWLISWLPPIGRFPSASEGYCRKQPNPLSW